MKKDLTSINVIIDQSGSMANLQFDTIGGFNQFLKDQQAAEGEAVMTVCTFSDKSKLVHDFVKVASVPSLNEKTYFPGGNTALLDAVGTTINNVGQKLAAMPEDERPSKVLFLIITDGQENASREYSKAKVKEMISHQRDKYNWEFVFMGANIDSIAEGTSLGIAAQTSMNYNATQVGTRSLYSTMSASTASYRRSGSYSVTPVQAVIPATPQDVVDPLSSVVTVTPVDPTTK